MEQINLKKCYYTIESVRIILFKIISAIKEIIMGQTACGCLETVDLDYSIEISADKN